MQDLIETYTIKELTTMFNWSWDRVQRHVWRDFIPVKIVMAQTRMNPKGYSVKYAVTTDILRYIEIHQKKKKKPWRKTVQKEEKKEENTWN